VERFLLFVDRLSMWVGRTFAWCILILTFGVSYEVFVRYVLRDPTSWAYDVSYIMYGALFLMAGAYTVSRDGHVRADVVYRLWPPRVQASIDLALFILFYFPAVTAFIYSGYYFARMSWQFGETSVYSPASIPVYQVKALIPIAGVVLFLQGISELVRCVRCIRSGAWPARYHDVEEMESAILHLHEDEVRLHHEHPEGVHPPSQAADR
jgi:TRAP-type mannitol/chloroaromatic compound transport system permease small subunit